MKPRGRYRGNQQIKLTKCDYSSNFTYKFENATKIFQIYPRS